MPTTFMTESAPKPTTHRYAGAYEKLCALQQPAAQRSRLWETVFGHRADFIDVRPKARSEDEEDETFGLPEGESFVVTHLTIRWIEMEEDAGPFGTNQKTY